MITIRHGCSSVTRDINGYDSYADVVGDANVRAVLGAVDAARVDIVVDGAVVDRADAVTDGEEIILVTKSNTKGC